MRKFSLQLFHPKQKVGGQDGFSLLELTVAMAVSSIVLAACVSTYLFLTVTYKKHKEVTRMHRKTRGPISIVSWETTMAGRSGLQPRSSANYGVTKITRMALDGTDDPAGYPAFVVQSLVEDYDGNGRIDEKDDPPHIITFRLYDFDGDGGAQPDFGKFEDDNRGNLANGGQPTITLIARNVENIGFAFATDSNRDGALDQINGATQWSVSVNDPAGQLNMQLDANGDGLVNVNDDTNADGRIDGGDGGLVTLGSSIQLSRIRQVKIYVLVRAAMPEPNYINKCTLDNEPSRQGNIGNSAWS